MTLSPQPTADSEAQSPDLSAISLSPSFQQTCFFVCGLLASGVREWREPALFVVLAGWLTADAALALVIAHLMGLKRAARGNEPAPATVPLDDWIREVTDEGGGVTLASTAESEQVTPLQRSRLRGHVVSALAGTGLVLALATYLGREPLLVAAGGLLIAAALSLVTPREPATLDHWMTGLHTSVAWLMGHAILAPLTGPSVGLALIAGIGVYVRERVDAGHTPMRWLLVWAWSILVIATIQGGHPIVTAVVAVSALASMMRVGARSSVTAQGWSRLRPRLSWLVSLALVAMASTHWG